nr:tetratricopeptide repeat protein [Bacteroidota bacterium]
MVARTFVNIFLFLLLVIVNGSNCFAQKFINLETYNVDSLLLILPGQQGVEKVNSLNNLAVSLSFIDYERSKQYADEAMNLSKDLDYKEGTADAFRNYGHIYFSQGNYPKALNNYHEALILYENLDNKHTAAWVCYDLAKTHYCTSNFEKTIEYGHMALNIFHEPLEGNSTVGNVRDTISIIEGLALAYENLGMLDRSLNLYQKAIEIGQENNFSMTELLIMTLKVGEDYFMMGNADSAKFYFAQALAYPDVNPHIQALKYRPLAGLGDFYYVAGEIDSALFYKQKAYDWYIDQGFLFWALKVSNELGTIYYQNNELNTAETYFRQSEQIFNEMLAKDSWYRYDTLKYIVNFGIELFFPHPRRQLNELMWEQVNMMYALLYQISAKTKSDEALNYHIAYYSATDTLNRLQRTRETLEIQTRYESDRKDQQIETLSIENELKESRLDQNRYFLFGSVGLFIVVLMFGYLMFRQNKLKTDQKMLGLQQKFFRSQMNPHFIFNSLASIQNFVVRQDSKKASIYLSRFSELVRSILDNSTQEYIPFEKEVATIENYLELQRVRFPEKFDFSIEVDEKIDPENMLIPPMLAQPFIENSIEHGFKHKKTRGTIKIQFSMHDKLITFEIEDDGIGREKAQEIGYKLKREHRSMATDITRERLTVLNKKLKQKISMVITDLKNEKNEPSGTKVVFDIPFKYV